MHLFLRKSEIVRKFILSNNHCSFTLTDKVVITSITNPLRKHQNEKYLCFSLFIFSQSKIQFETLEQYRPSEEHFTHHLYLLTREKRWIYTDLKN